MALSAMVVVYSFNCMILIFKAFFCFQSYVKMLKWNVLDYQIKSKSCLEHKLLNNEKCTQPKNARKIHTYTYTHRYEYVSTCKEKEKYPWILKLFYVFLITCLFSNNYFRLCTHSHGHKYIYSFYCIYLCIINKLGKYFKHIFKVHLFFIWQMYNMYSLSKQTTRYHYRVYVMGWLI